MSRKPKKKVAKKASKKKVQTKKKANGKKSSMSRRQYLAALEELGLTVASQKTAEAFGLGLRQCQRIASGKVDVPPPVERLIAMYLKHGLDGLEHA